MQPDEPDQLMKASGGSGYRNEHASACYNSAAAQQEIIPLLPVMEQIENDNIHVRASATSEVTSLESTSSYARIIRDDTGSYSRVVHRA
jgi:hypothetical protein